MLQTEITILHLLAGLERKGSNNHAEGFAELGGKLCSLQEPWACDTASIGTSLLLGHSRTWLWTWVVVRAGTVPAFWSGCRAQLGSPPGAWTLWCWWDYVTCWSAPGLGEDHNQRTLAAAGLRGEVQTFSQWGLLTSPPPSVPLLRGYGSAVGCCAVAGSSQPCQQLALDCTCKTNPRHTVRCARLPVRDQSSWPLLPVLLLLFSPFAIPISSVMQVLSVTVPS